MRPSEVLRAAAATVRERGLAKGTFEDEHGRVCALGALRLVSFGDARTGAYYAAPSGVRRDYLDAKAALKSTVLTTSLDTDLMVTFWSDEHSRTAEEVAEQMERAAVKLEADWATGLGVRR